MIAQPIPRRSGRRLRLPTVVVGVLAALLVAGSGIAFLQTTVVLEIGIESGSALAGGAATEVTPIIAPITRTQGAAQLIAGHQVYRIRVADAAKSDRVKAHFSWLDSHNSSGVLGNPNAFMEAALYYQVGLPVGGACGADQFKTIGSDGATEICVARAAPAHALGVGTLTKASANPLLVSTTAGQEYLYLLVSIHVPGGTPQGQQPISGSLQFHVEVH